MKKARRKTVVALLIAFLMVAFVFTGCTQQEADEPDETKQATEAKATDAPKEEATPTEEEPKIESISFATNAFYTQPEYGDMFADLFFADTGVQLEIIQIARDEYNDKVAAMFMSGDMPDIVRMGSGGEFFRYVKQEFLVDQAPLIEANAEIKAIVDKNPQLTYMFTVGDAIYGISFTNYNTFNMWVRNDWLRDNNIAMPGTMDELIDMLKMFRDNDYDGNGEIDTIPITLPNSPVRMDMFAAYFGTRNVVYMEDGKAIDPLLTPEYKEYIEFMKMLYDEKLLDQEVPTNGSYGAIRTKFYNSQAGSIMMWADIYDTLYKGLVNNGIEGYDNIAVVPAIEGPKGTFGFSYRPPDSPNIMTTAVEYTQQVFNTFYGWYFASENGVIATSRGIEGFSFDIVDGVIAPINPDYVANWGQSLPPINMDFVYPFQFDPVMQNEYDNIIKIFADFEAHPETHTKVVSAVNEDYLNVQDDWEDKTEELFHAFLLGNIDYDGFVQQYTEYKEEIDFDTIVANIQP